MVRSSRSVRRLLLGWLLVPLTAVVCASAATSYHASLRIALDAYDRALLDPVLAIAQRVSAAHGRVEIDLPPAAQDIVRIDSVDRVFFSVRARGDLLAGQHGLPAPPEQPLDGGPVFYDGVVGAEPVRVAALSVSIEGGPVLVQVAETRIKRNRLVGQLLLSSVGPDVLLFFAALAVVWFGVARGLAPLGELRAELASRSPRDLRPLADTRAPEEVRPLVQELNRMLGRLAEAVEAQERFVADAAHQLRTPLAALQAQVEAARREGLPPELAPTVERLHAATRRAAHLVRQLLTLAAVAPSSERPFVPEAVDLSRVVQPGVADRAASAGEKRIDFGCELEPVTVRGEAHLLEELVANLLDNALNYAPEGGQVTLRTGRHGERPFLEVEDNGPGIPESERERVFERFHRVRGTPGEGTGLGLPIVREIALRHGAEIHVRAPAYGSGTVVTVSFPMAIGANEHPV